MGFEQVGDVAACVVAARVVAKIANGEGIVERFPITERAMWLKMREPDITASVAAALFGVHPYATSYSLWATKTGKIADDVEETPPMRRGRLLEPVALKLLAEERPAWSIEPGAHYYRDPRARIGATPDAFAVDPSRSGRGAVQIKTVEPSIFRKNWRGEDGATDVPLWIAVQATVEASLTGASWACVVAMTAGHGLDLHIVDVPLIPPLMDRLKGLVADFWRLVESDKTPDPDYGRDGALIEKLFEPTGEVIDLSSDNALPDLADERARLSASKGETEKRLKVIKAEFLAKLGDASAARMADGRLITAKRVNRAAYSVKETSFVDVRIKATA